ncbi:MAG: Crp/Fnr family transcriptional regulator [Chthonomonadales bacterium]|nr:Crp/Fnr family transcriptional regulator [Chthonomonadales bacterium]
MQVLLSQLSEALEPKKYEQIHRMTSYFDEGELKVLQQVCISRTLEPYEKIFGVGDAAHEIYIVLSGEIITWVLRPDNKMLVLDITERGGACGEAATIGQIKRTASMSVLKKAEILVLSDEHLDDFIQDYPSLYRQITQGMVERLQRSATDLRNARLRDTTYSETRPLSIWDRLRMGPGIALGSYWFLVVFGVVVGFWFYQHQHANLDPNLLWLPLWLSIVQIVIGTLVLESQLHTQKLDEEYRRREREANLHGERVIETFEEKQNAHNVRVNLMLERVEAFIEAQGKLPIAPSSPNMPVTVEKHE